MRTEIITFPDAETDNPCKVYVNIEHRGICIKPEGTATLDGDYGPIFLEIVHGRPVLHIWPDVNEQEPIKIDLAGALESNRQAVVM